MDDLITVASEVLDHCLIHLPVANRLFSQPSRINELVDSLPTIDLPSLTDACKSKGLPEPEAKALWEIFRLFCKDCTTSAALGLFLTLQNFQVATKRRPQLETRASLSPPRGFRTERPAPAHAAAFFRRYCPARFLGARAFLEPTDIEPVIINGAVRTTVHVDDIGRRLVIANVTESTIYVSHSFQDVLIWGCSDCEIVLVYIGRIITVSHCDRLTVRATCDFLHAETVTASRLFLLTRRFPVISGDSRGCTLAPFNVIIPSVKGFDRTDAAKFAFPVCASLDDPFTLLAPDKFSPCSNPWGLQGTLPPLPQVYADALAERKKRMHALREEVNAIGDEGAKRQVMTILQGHFREWLMTNGAAKYRQLIELSKLSS